MPEEAGPPSFLLSGTIRALLVLLFRKAFTSRKLSSTAYGFLSQETCLIVKEKLIYRDRLTWVSSQQVY